MTVDEFLATDDALCSFSGSYNTIFIRLSDPTANVAAITEAVELDPTIAAKTLKVANSSLYGFPEPIDTLHRAVSIIGLQQMRQIVMSTVVIEHFRGVPVIGVDMESFWRHSLAVGVLSRSIARFRREANIERLYLYGIMHDLGRLLMFLHLSSRTDELINIRERERMLLFEAETEFLGFDHATIGAELMEHWNMSPAQVEATRFHHAPRDAQAFPVETAIVHVADSIANALRLGSSGERFVPPVEAETFDRIGLEMETYEAVIGDARKQLGQMQAILLD
ncbi:metal dependent phosphohydrolase [Thioalkalivibrio sp. K90mix]|uniref:HDOD domain-containing protein n=1 Tax=Thioalkalivibrio sp. (strain K90mix) TaxID=396595 RepID=UPI000195ABBA|nr:HDOD domain-containing protein [Thioalkalivibrio sp. K90mix]ADC71779.1 metal dependent phosphohydrolase [Thioalkalivibrio sp. K90mix]